MKSAAIKRYRSDTYWAPKSTIDDGGVKDDITIGWDLLLEFRSTHCVSSGDRHSKAADRLDEEEMEEGQILEEKRSGLYKCHLIVQSESSSTEFGNIAPYGPKQAKAAKGRVARSFVLSHADNMVNLG